MHIKTILAAAAVMGMTSGAWALDASDCGSLPNPNWSWSISYSQPIITGGVETVTENSSTTYSGNTKSGNSGLNGFETTSTTTEVSAKYEQVNLICTALNPQGNVSTGNSKVVNGEPQLIAEASSSTTDPVTTKICGPGGALGACK
jgi:hypothetical protein